MKINLTKLKINILKTRMKLSSYNAKCLIFSVVLFISIDALLAQETVLLSLPKVKNLSRISISYDEMK